MRKQMATNGQQESDDVHAQSCRKEIVRTFYELIWDQQRTELMPKFFQRDFTFRGSLSCELVGNDEFTQYVQWLTSTLHGYRSEILGLVEEGNQVWAKLRFHGEQRKIFFGHAPSNQHVWWDGLAIFTFENAMVSDLWVLGDIHGLICRLGKIEDGMEFEKPTLRSAVGLPRSGSKYR